MSPLPDIGEVERKAARDDEDGVDADIVVGPPMASEAASDDALDAALRTALETLTPSRAAAEVAASLNIPRKRAYARALALGSPT